MGDEARKSIGCQGNSSHFIFNAGSLVHALSIRVGEAEYKLLGAIRNRDTARLLRLVFSGLVRCDGNRERNAIDEVIVFERALWIVLYWCDFGDSLIGRHLNYGLGEREEWESTWMKTFQP